MKQDWTNLAKTGVPAVGWPRFSPTSQQVLSLVPPQPQVETDFSAQHHCAFWPAAH
jgi:para-nitrobenzyl esterase